MPLLNKDTKRTAIDGPDTTMTAPLALTKSQVAKNYIGDFFHLPEDYPERIARYPDTQLKKSEAVKTRICYSCVCSTVSAIVFAGPTHGGSAVICVWAARRYYVAFRKLNLIKAELTKRGLALRPFLHRDWLIPASIAIVGASIGLGVELGLGVMVPIGKPGIHGSISLTDPGHLHPIKHALLGSINNAPDPSLLDASSNGTAANVIQVSTHCPLALHNTVQGKNAVQYFFNGLADQIRSAFGSHHAIAGNTLDATYHSAAAWVAGANSAQIMEKQLAVLLGTQSVSIACERLDSESLIPRNLRQFSCSRLPWAIDNMCSQCSEPISSGRFYHCCKCIVDDEELTLCLKCHKCLPDSHDETHELIKSQTALPGRVFLPSAAKSLSKKIAGPKALSCSACGIKITRRWYYDCWECRKLHKTWTECGNCYVKGRTCEGDDTHSFYAFRRTVFARYNDHTPYQKLGEGETGSARCSACHKPVTKGAYYNCSKCIFDVCEVCFAQDHHCNSARHTLKKYYAWNYKRRMYRDEWCDWICQSPHCQFRERKDGFFFSCLETGCGSGKKGFAVCAPCYFEDVMCPIREHEMFKCVWG